jgi:hypothetical protein
MTFRHLCLFKIIGLLMVFIIVALGEFDLFVFISHNKLTGSVHSLLEFPHSSFIVTKVIFIRTFLPSFTFILICLCMSLSIFFFSLSHFFDRYKNGTPCAPILASRCLVSFVPFSARFGFALRAFNLFAPSPCTSLCI